MKYRPEIDGLRAIAVISVMLFHAGFATVSGGFVGVDIFFVISGYLITSIILFEKQAGEFSLGHFYERRARRILPALFLMMFICFPLAWYCLLPSHFQDFSRSLISTLTFSSNIFFWNQSGYFDTANELKPLLHTWSLAIEEQYYLIFPLFLLFTWRYAKQWMVFILTIVALMSLSLAHWGSFHKPVAAFYLLPTRSFELLMGVLVAFYLFYRSPNVVLNRRLEELLSIIGIFLVCFSTMHFSNATPFPGLYALVPTVGAALIILFGTQKTIVGKALGSKWLVGVGLISYSAYLWHQPLIVFARHYSLDEPTKLYLFGLIVLSFAIAFVSWKFVEIPFRDKKVVNKKNLIKLLSVGFSLLFVLGSLGQFPKVFPEQRRVNGQTTDEIEYRLRVNYGLSEVCESTFTLAPQCRTSDEPEVLVLGDSYAMHLVPGLIASNPDIKMIQMTKSNCGPFFGSSPAFSAQDCLDFNHEVMAWLKSQHTIKYAVLALSFDRYFTDPEIMLANNNLVINQLMQTLDYLESMGIKPVIFAPTPMTGKDIGQCLATATKLSKPLYLCDFRRDEITVKRNINYQLFKRFENKYHIVWLNDMICDQNKCKASLESVFTYRDIGHLSYEGSAILGERNRFYDLIVMGK